MLTAQLTGADTLGKRLTDLPADLQAALQTKAADLAERLRRHVTDDKLSGQVLHTRTGALKASIAADVSDQTGQVLVRVFSAGDVKYAAIQEYGGQTSPHDIVPGKAKVLAFVLHGGPVFARRIHHPGSHIPERSYLRSSLADMADQIVAEFKNAAIAAVRGESP
jgi:phage gpG-like protein